MQHSSRKKVWLAASSLLLGTQAGLLLAAPGDKPEKSAPPAKAPVAANQAKPVAPAMAAEQLQGQLNEKQLGELLEALGLKVEKQQQRFDFAFEAPVDDQKWQLSMSTVLSQDQESVWVIAWLDELPKDATQVPRTALLKLLAANDQLGTGKFFAYIPNARRFVMQQVVPNENLTSAQMRLILQDLGTAVVETYGTWSVTNWSPKSNTEAQASDATGGSKPGATGKAGSGNQGPPTRSAQNEPKDAPPAIRR